MNSTRAARYFSGSYAEARQKFLDAAALRGVAVESFVHPQKGAQGETLATDVALVGAPDAEKLLLVSSATHGPEG
ncbi:MAG: DUF2817 domain-containing protein, partial [Pseudomonadota bacterium]